MQTVTAPIQEYSDEGVLFFAMELSESKWKLASATSLASRVREVTIEAGDLCRLQGEIGLAKRRLGLSERARVVACYEAGRDGFWLYRALIAAEIGCVVVDPSSVEVSRRKRRAKTDRLDVQKLLRGLMRWHRGERDVWRVVRVPSVEAEDERQLHRELEVLKRERGRHSNRIGALLKTQGISLPIKRDFLAQLCEVRLFDGSPVPRELRRRLEREYQRLDLAREQVRELERERKEALGKGTSTIAEVARRLYEIRGIGANCAWVTAGELFAWRRFDNRRQVAAAAGLTPTPYSSGSQEREQGISKAGNRRVRSIITEIAWLWLRFQPDSELSRWYQERFGSGSARARRVGIVALARRLLIALWRYLETGVVPEGAVLKA